MVTDCFFDAFNARTSIKISSLLVVTLGFFPGTEVDAHGGGLNSQGCHNNRKTGDYHCHRAQLPLEQPIAQLRPDEATLPSKATESSSPVRPICHVGPRGGTYTITSSGRKNYGGC